MKPFWRVVNTKAWGNLNFSNRPVRTRTPGGVGGDRPERGGPYPDYNYTSLSIESWKTANYRRSLWIGYVANSRCNSWRPTDKVNHRAELRCSPNVSIMRRQPR